MRKFVVLAVLVAFTLSAAPAKKRPATNAPADVPHAIALFLCAMSNNGGRQVTYKARALGVRFYLEEPGGVTVYRFVDDRYVREEFLQNYSLDRAVKRYAKK